MSVVAQAIQFRSLVWSLILLSVALLVLSLHAIGEVPFYPPVVFKLESKWGTPGSVTVYATRNGGGIISTFGDRAQLVRPQFALLSPSEMTELRTQLNTKSYRSLSADAFENLRCDARFGPCDEDVYVMSDWLDGAPHTVECFSEEGGVGQAVADWLLRKAGVQHEYHCS